MTTVAVQFRYLTGIKVTDLPQRAPDRKLGCRRIIFGPTCARGRGMLAAGPELRITGAAAQTRMVSVARIRLVSRKSTRLFKGILCDDISEFETHMPSHAVRSPPVK